MLNYLDQFPLACTDRTGGAYRRQRKNVYRGGFCALLQRP